MNYIFNFFSRSIKSTITLYENNIKAKLSKFKNAEKSFRKMIKDALHKVVSFIFGKPTSVKDYFKVSSWYISKRFAAKCIGILIIFIILMIYVVIPYLSGRLWASSLVVNTNEYHEFTGKCRVYKEDGSLLYIGTLENGVITGSGELYENDKLVYKGDFEKNKYEGNGDLYLDGNILYKGEFTNNEYNGKGTLFYANGNEKFEGEFENGIYKKGTEYYESGNKKYVGEFANELYTGEAELYADDEVNTVMFKGTFGNGKYNGEGNLYSGGNLIYEGEFADSKYNGKGKQYINGILLYEGEFADGKYNGEGNLYNIINGKILYQGAFSNSKYEGEGTLYDENTGKLLYKGNFSENLYNEKGTLFNVETGRVIYDGNFVNSLYDGDGVLYSDNGKKLFTGRFFEGNINYMDFLNKDIEYIRTCFGKEDKIETYETSFDIIYNDLKLIFEFDYSQDDGEQPMFSRVKFFGEQKINDIAKGIHVDEINKTFEEKSFTAYSFAAGQSEVGMNSYIDNEITDGMVLYSVKYLFDDYYIRVYALNEKSQVMYFEMGGV